MAYEPGIMQPVVPDAPFLTASNLLLRLGFPFRALPGPQSAAGDLASRR